MGSGSNGSKYSKSQRNAGRVSQARNRQKKNTRDIFADSPF